MIMILLAAVFLVSTALLVRHRAETATSTKAYNAAEEIAAQPREALGSEEPEPDQPVVEEMLPTGPVSEEPRMEWVVAPVEEDEHMKKLKDINLDALREKNPAVVGWIFIPNGKMNYPIVQGEDNQHYLKYTWDQRKSASGAIFMESTNNPDFSDFRTIIYGHNMADFSMFGSLTRYDTEKNWKKCPYVYLVTDEGVLRYEIYSSYKADVDSGTYALEFKDDRYRAALIKLTKDEARYETGITPTVTDRLLTLSTCVGDAYARRVVHARLPMIQVEVKTDSPQAENLQ